MATSSLFEENAYLLFAESARSHRRRSRARCRTDRPRTAEGRAHPVAILNTHGHGDHIAGNELLKQTWPAAPLIIGAGDAWKLD